MGQGRPSKDEARALAYRRLREAKAARFPFPPEGRIPNFSGAQAAAEQLRTLDVYRRARALKVNPDAAQAPVRAMALRDGKTLYLAAARLSGPFLRIDSADVPAGQEAAAARLGTRGQFGRCVDLAAVAQGRGAPPPELVVVGSVAVGVDGTRAGKGEGFADLEYAALRRLGLPPVPVVTTVHPSQVQPSLVDQAHDLRVDWIATPQGVHRTRNGRPQPAAVDWTLLGARALEMPALAELRRGEWLDLTLPDVVAPGLVWLFVGINPGRASAVAGHHFAGPGNHFWSLLHDGGLTPRRLDPAQDGRLPRFGIGITNVVTRASRGEQDLDSAEFAAGGAALRAKVARLRPRLVALLGKRVYRAYAGLRPSAAIDFGLQSRQTVAGVAEFAAPNPSARSALPYAVRLAQMRAVRDCGLLAEAGVGAQPTGSR